MWVVVLRAIERYFVYGGGVLLIWLGYKLFRYGPSKGRGELKAKSRLGEIILSGSGPGLFFMAFGALILLVGLRTGGVEITFDPNEVGRMIGVTYASLEERITRDLGDIRDKLDSEADIRYALQKSIAELRAEQKQIASRGPDGAATDTRKLLEEVNKRLKEVSISCNQLKDELAALKSSHERLRAQLDEVTKQ